MADKQEKTPRSRRELINLVLAWLFWGPMILVIFSPLIVGCYIYLNPCLCSVRHSFFEAIERDDKAAVFKYAKAYERREKKSERRRHGKEKAMTYNLLYMIANELNEDYDKALACETEYSEKRKTSRPAYDDYDLFGSPYDRARLLYKKGLKKEAFIEYCSKQTIDEDYKACLKIRTFSTLEEYEAFLKGFKRGRQNWITLRTSQDYEAWRMKFSCFPEYADFLDFINAEYEKLGRPEEYAEAVEKYRLLTSEQDWYCDPPELKPALIGGMRE